MKQSFMVWSFLLGHVSTQKVQILEYFRVQIFLIRVNQSVLAKESFPVFCAG
jgi:hypothetical protein